MKKLLFSITLAFSLTSCFLIENKESKAIEICQNSKVQFLSDNNSLTIFLNEYGLGVNATWLDFANLLAKKDVSKIYNWRASKTKDNNIFIVEFVDSNDWGQRWEVDIEQQIVRAINQSEYLSKKYGYTRLSHSGEFEIIECEKSKLKINKPRSLFDDFTEELYAYDSSNESNTFYVFKASVINKSGKTITAASINGTLKLIFKNKCIQASGNYESGFNSNISEKNPWEPNTTRSFFIRTKEIDKIYLNYVPDYVVFTIQLKAYDPVGYSFEKDVIDIDLKDNWKSLQDEKLGKHKGQDIQNVQSRDNEINIKEEDASTISTAIKLLFNNVKTNITQTDKINIYKKIGFHLSKDKKHFVVAGCSEEDEPSSLRGAFDAEVLPTDMNNDGIDEIFISYGNLCTSGNTGSSIILFIKGDSGYMPNIDNPGLIPEALTTSNNGYFDLVIVGPGFEYPIWSWNGNEYVYKHNLKNKDWDKTKKKNIAEISKSYTNSL